MAKILSLTGIVTGLPVEAHHVSQSIKALTGAEAYDISISGSLGVVGTTTLQIVSGSDFSGSFQGDGTRLTGITSSFITSSDVRGPHGTNSILSSSYTVTSSFSDFATLASSSLVSDFTLTANSATSASYAITSSFAQTASFVLGTVETASFVTGSNVYGPHGSNSILSASFAVSSSIAESASFASASLSSISSSRAELAGIALTSNTASYVKLAESASYIRPINLKAAGSNSQVQFNNDGNFSGASQLIYSQSNGNLSIGTSSYSDHTLEVAGQISQTGLCNSVALGRDALKSHTSGLDNIAIGEQAGCTISSARRNIAIGSFALKNNNSGNGNVAIGYTTLQSSTGGSNIGIGSRALGCNLGGGSNIGIGSTSAFNNTSGNNNLSIGNSAAYCNCTGCSNISIGNDANFSNCIGSKNVAIGNSSIRDICTGTNNVAVGFEAGCKANLSSTGNVFLGAQAGPSSFQTISNKLFIHNAEGSPLICGDFSNREVNIDGALTASGLIYPTADGSANQVLTTDGSGKLSFAAAGTVETASYVKGENVDGPLGMNTISTSSFAVTASFALSGGGGGSATFTPFQTGSVACFILPKLGSNCCFGGNFAIVAGGENNHANGNHSFVGAGKDNTASSNCTVVFGQESKTTGFRSFVFGYRSYNCGNYGIIMGQLHSGSAHSSTIIGGATNKTCTQNSAIIGASSSCIHISGETDSYSSILGGQSQFIIGTSGGYSVIGGGRSNQICNAPSSSILSGFCNCARHCNTHVIGSNLCTDKTDYTFVNNLDAEGTISSSIFSGSYVGDGSGLTNLTLTGDITIFNNNIRYEAYNSTQVVEILSSGTVFTGIDWSRSSTTITITSPSHGLTNGDYVVVRNMGDTDYVYGAISGVTTNTFQITNAVGSGAVSGTTGAYIPAAGATGVSTSGATITAPSAGNIQIQSIKVITGTTLASSFDLTMPTSINNGAGANSSLLNMNPPIIAAHRLDTGGYNGNARITVNTSTNFNVFTVNNITALRNNLIRFTF